MVSLMAFDIMAQSMDWAKLSRYEPENVALRSQPDGVKVVFMGNSITEGWVEMHPAFFTDNGFVGRGISGQTSSQMLLRFRQDVISLRPKVVVINAGTNDIAENTGPYNEVNTFGNIISMVELAKASKIKVIMTSVLPAAKFHWNPNVTDAAGKVERLNKALRAYAAQHKIEYVDYYTPLVTGTERALNPSYSLDGVHPELSGYAVMEPLAVKAIREALGMEPLQEFWCEDCR